MTWKKLIERGRRELRLTAWRHLREGHPADAYHYWALSRKLGTRTRIFPPLIMLPRFVDYARRIK